MSMLKKLPRFVQIKTPNFFKKFSTYILYINEQLPPLTADHRAGVNHKHITRKRLCQRLDDFKCFFKSDDGILITNHCLTFKRLNINYLK